MLVHRLSVLVLGCALAGTIVFSNTGRPHQVPQQQVPGNLVPGTVTPGATAVHVANQPAVQVVNRPTVDAAQAGEWRMTVPGGLTLARGTSVGIAPPDFVQPGRRYTIRWESGVSGTYTIAQVSGAWVLVGTSPRRSWVNLGLAVGIDEAN